ncbi:aminoacyl-tRNA hydrolase [Candidatus Kaiserbacteria bacterium]|nr:aminoacyl-tRNA hydrolase [Candidatus Kaiserbacteria bacterium]
MRYIIAGLGNKGEKYEGTRHNAGRVAVEHFRKTQDFPGWKEDAKRGYLISKGVIGKHPVLLVLPERFMNTSGTVLKPLVSEREGAEKLVVVHDDIDLGLGDYKISFGRSSGGHRGVESIIKALKTKNFTRVRIGISPVTTGGKVKKPRGEEKVLEFLLGVFQKKEELARSRSAKKIDEMLRAIVTKGRSAAMNAFN